MSKHFVNAVLRNYMENSFKVEVYQNKKHLKAKKLLSQQVRADPKLGFQGEQSQINSRNDKRLINPSCRNPIENVKRPGDTMQKEVVPEFPSTGEDKKKHLSEDVITAKEFAELIMSKDVKLIAKVSFHTITMHACLLKSFVLRWGSAFVSQVIKGVADVTTIKQEHGRKHRQIIGRLTKVYASVKRRRWVLQRAKDDRVVKVRQPCSPERQQFLPHKHWVWK